MTLIQSMEDLARAKEEAAKRQSANNQQPFNIRVSVASCGLAAGAGDTLKAINRMIASQNLEGIRVTQIGCLGLCALEPIVQVQAANQPQVTYGKVTPEVARRIIQEHIGNGIIVQQYVVDSI